MPTWVIVAALGAVAGGGVLALLRAVFPPTPSLDDDLRALAASNWSTQILTPNSPATGGEPLVGRFLVRVFDLRSPALATDLRVIDRSFERHVAERAKTAVALGVAPILFGVAIPVVAGGGALFGSGVITGASVVGAVVGWFWTDHQVRSMATKRRREFDAGLASYLGLVASLTAAGSGLEEAMWVGAQQGRGWAFQVLRRALTAARNRGSTPWEMMDTYGRDLELPALVELGATFQLSGTSGAQLRQTVMTKAASLREHQLAGIEAEANANTTAMAGPIGFMLAGFVVLLLYPAITTVLNL